MWPCLGLSMTAGGLDPGPEALQSTLLTVSHLPIISHPLAFYNDYVLALTTDDGRVLRFSLPSH